MANIPSNLLEDERCLAVGALVGTPAIVRADAKEVVIGGPAGAAKYFNADVFPIIEKKLGIKVIYEGTNSLTNLQKMTADKDAPKMSVVIMDDPVMLVAAKERLITPITSRARPISQAPSGKRPSGRHVGELPDALGWDRLEHQGRLPRPAGRTSRRPAAGK